MKKNVLAAAAVVALAAIPVAGVQAKPPGERGDRAERGGERQSTERGGARRDGERRSGERGRSRRCARQVRRGFVVRGSLTSFEADSVTLEVQRANRHARRWLRDNEPVFDTSDARVRFGGVTDGNGDGAVDFADVVATDRVRVIGKVSSPKRRCEGETTVSIRKVIVTRETEEEEEEAPAQEPAPTTEGE